MKITDQFGEASIDETQGLGFAAVKQLDEGSKIIGVLVTQHFEVSSVVKDMNKDYKEYTGPVYENGDMEIRTVKVTVVRNSPGEEGIELHFVNKEHWDKKVAEANEE